MFLFENGIIGERESPLLLLYCLLFRICLDSVIPGVEALMVLLYELRHDEIP